MTILKFSSVSPRSEASRDEDNFLKLLICLKVPCRCTPAQALILDKLQC